MDYYFLRFYFICLKAHTEYAFWWLCITNRGRLKDSGLGLWKTQAGNSILRLWVHEAGLGGFFSVIRMGQGESGQSSCGAVTNGEREEVNLENGVKTKKRQKFNMPDLVNVKVLLDCVINTYLSSHVCSILSLHQGIIFSIM